MKIEELKDISFALYKCLTDANITTTEQLCDCTITDLYKIRNLGTKLLNEIYKLLDENGLTLKKEYETGEGCSYCDLDNYKDRTYLYEKEVKALCLDDGNYTALYIAYDKDTNEYYLMASGEDSANKPISFCPECGRNLK